MGRTYYHELRKQIEDYVRERGLEEAMITFTAWLDHYSGNLERNEIDQRINHGQIMKAVQLPDYKYSDRITLLIKGQRYCAMNRPGFDAGSSSNALIKVLNSTL